MISHALLIVLGLMWRNSPIKGQFFRSFPCFCFFQIHSIAFDRMHSSEVLTALSFFARFSQPFRGDMTRSYPFVLLYWRPPLSSTLTDAGGLFPNRVWNRILNFQDFDFLHLLIPNYQCRLCVLGIILESINTILDIGIDLSGYLQL